MQVGLRRLDGFMPEPQRDHGAGCATEAVVLRAALSALERGYRVQVPVDARSGLSARTENAALRQIEAAGGASILARCARLLGLPVHHSVVPEGGKAPEVLPDLAKETEGAPQFARMTADPFLDPQTREAIDAVKRPVLVIAGLATEAVVLHAALSALERDYRVQVPVDACGGLSARTEDAALRQIEAAGGVTTSVVSLVTAMAPDFAREPGRNTFAALQALRLA
jgi:nicotinamidase-related amidase